MMRVASSAFATDSFQHAIDTLRKLHTQSGRHVGIISHVEDLKESITTQIQVHQSPGTNTSHIEVVTR